MANTTLVKAENPFVGKIDLPKIELVTITSADGKTPLNGRIIYPSNFDATKKYPVMVYLYGGSHAQLVTNRWLSGAVILICIWLNKAILYLQWITEEVMLVVKIL